MSDWEKLRQQILGAFADVPRPNFDSISIIGCCEEHEKDFEWYRRHTWQEFEAALETRGFDPADFVAIHPSAFHYFTPGVVTAAMKRLVTDAKQYWDDDSWIQHYIIAPYRIESFKTEYLPCFDSMQRQAVAETIAWYKQWFIVQHGYDYDDPDEYDEDFGRIIDTINLVWLSETQNNA